MSNLPQDSKLNRLLDREVSDEYLREQTAHVARAKPANREATQSAVIFRIGNEWLALPTVVFVEVVESCSIHAVPHRRGGLLAGLVSVRGEILLCADLSSLLGVEKPARQPATHDGITRLLVCMSPNGRFAFRVDEVQGVIRYQASEMRDMPSTLAGTSGNYATGILPWNGIRAGFLDEQRLFRALNNGLG